MTTQLTHERLKQLLVYNPKTGIFRWRVARPPNKRWAIAGSTKVMSEHRAYVRIKIEYEEWLAHRLAWFYMTGEIPKGVMDHRNGDGTDNRWDNLRLVDYFVNAQNHRRFVGNESGRPFGVNKSGNRYVYSIQRNGTRVKSHSFATAEEAGEAYQVARKLLHDAPVLEAR